MLPLAASTAAELERVTEAMLNQMFADDCDEVPFEALFARLAAEDARVAAAGRAAVVKALAAMQVADKIVHSGANIHLICVDERVVGVHAERGRTGPTMS